MIKCEKLLTKIVGAGGLGSSTTSSYSSGFGGGYCSGASDGTSYSYYSNNGFEQGETYNTRTFADDSNAHARNDGNGVVNFVSLN